MQTAHNPALLSAQHVAHLAREAAEEEAGASPKPGLVCPNHQGAHRDMCHATFMASAAAIEPYFQICVQLGRAHGSQQRGELFLQLRAAGQQAESDMFAATNGVNTHKGLIFSLGLLCASLGCLQAEPACTWGETTQQAKLEGLLPHEMAIMQTAHALTADAACFVHGVVERELEPLRRHLPERPLTAGERLYLQYGVVGARGEASRGFPGALLALRSLLINQRDLEPQRAVPQTLLELMAVIEDTNVLARGGMEGLSFVREQASVALASGGMRTPEGRAAVLRFQEACVERWLSPGGCADLIAVAFFLSRLGAAAPNPTRGA